MNRLLKSGLSRAFGVAAVVSLALPLDAQTGPAPDSDVFTLTVGTAQYSYTLPEGSPLEGQLIEPGVNGKGIEGDPGMFGKPIVLMDSPTVISDVFGVIQDNNSPSGFALAFISDDEKGNPATIPGNFYDNNGNIAPVYLAEDQVPNGVDVSSYVYQGYGQGQVVTAHFTSDVPDGGATLALLGVAGLGLAGLRRKLA